jgi:hypothetical protein
MSVEFIICGSGQKISLTATHLKYVGLVSHPAEVAEVSRPTIEIRFVATQQTQVRYCKAEQFTGPRPPQHVDSYFNLVFPSVGI